MAAIAVYTAVQPFLDVLSFAAGVVSAIYDDSPFKAIVKAQGDSAQGNYAAPFGRQNAFAAGRGVGHAVSIVGGIVEVVAGGALVSGGTAVTTTGVLAPAGVAAVAGGAAIAAAGVARVATTVAAVSAGDPNFQFSTSTSGGAAGGTASENINLDNKPNANSKKLQNFIDSLYKGQGNPNQIGNGTTMDSIRYELATGNPVEGKFHSQKGQEFMSGINKLINSGDLNAHDKAIAKAIVDDIANALAGR